jgi:hypothetical protein
MKQPKEILHEGGGDIDSNQRGRQPDRSHQGDSTQIIGTRGKQPEGQSKGKGKESNQGGESAGMPFMVYQ